MKIYSLALILLLGCASKPKCTSSSFYNEIRNNTFVAEECPVGAALQYDVISEKFGCIQVEPEHVTRAQWEAAQGLYVWYVRTGNGDDMRPISAQDVWKYFICDDQSGKRISCKDAMTEMQGTIYIHNPGGLIGDTFPPSGNAK